MQTHLEPLAECRRGGDRGRSLQWNPRSSRTGAAPRELRFVRTDEGIVAFLTLALAGEESLAGRTVRRSAVEERVRRAVPAIADVVVHTEP